jgi:alpha-1,4-digalacturonate transport system substrate-binding protein
MRRTLIAVATIGLLGALAACAPGPVASPSGGGNGAAPSGGTIDYSTFKGKKITYLYFTDGPDEAATRALLKEFEAKSGGTVDLQIIPYADLQQSLQARLSGGNAPDVARLSDIEPFKGDLLDLHGYLGKDYEKEFQAGPTKSVLRDGKMLGVPNDLTMNGPFINVDQFKKAGVEVPTKGWKWEELVAAARKVQQANGTEAGIAIDKSPHRLSTVLSEYGTTYVGSGLKSTLDDTKGTAAVNLLLGLIKDGTMSRDFWIESGSKYKGANDMFLAGQAPVYISGNWQVAQFATAAKFAWATVPNPCAERCGGFPGGKFTVAFQGSKEQSMAAALVQFLNSKESQEKMDQQSMWLPTRNDLVKSGVQYPSRTEDMKVFIGDVEKTPEDTYDAVASPAFGACGTPLIKEFAKAVAGQQDAATVVKNTKAECDKVISGLKK